MLLSRFWYVVLALLLGGALFVLHLATSRYNRRGTLAMSEALSADGQVVGWYLKDDARLSVWGMLYEGGIAQVNAESYRADVSGSALTARTCPG